jgi:hypothetical protein
VQGLEFNPQYCKNKNKIMKSIKNYLGGDEENGGGGEFMYDIFDIL